MENLNITKNEYVKLRESGLSKEQIVNQYGKKTFGQNLMRTAQGVTKFVGGQKLSEAIGGGIAKLTVPKEQRQFVDLPTAKETIGSALQVGSSFIPAARGASLLSKVGRLALTGYSYDVGRNLEQQREGADILKPGIGTVTAPALPVLGKIIGFATTKAPASLSRKLEEISLRLTPIEKQNLDRKGQDIAEYLSKKKIMGSPQRRYLKVNNLYNSFEDKISNVIKKSGAKFQKNKLVSEISQIPSSFVDDPELQNEAVRITDKLIENIQSRSGDFIDADVVQNLKRAYFKRAFAKNATDVVSDSRLAIGGYLKGLLDDSIKGLKPLNKEYGYIIASNRALQKATTRSQIGLTGKLVGAGAGASLGGVIGGGVGAAAGTVVGPSIGKAIAGTPTRSVIGAGARTFSELSQRISQLKPDSKGNISAKAVLNILEKFRE